MLQTRKLKQAKAGRTTRAGILNRLIFSEIAIDAASQPLSPFRLQIHFAGVAQLVEHHLAKVDVESSSLFARSIFKTGKPPESPGGFLFVRHYARMESCSLHDRIHAPQISMKNPPLAAFAFALVTAFVASLARAQAPSATFRPSLVESCAVSYSYSGKSGYKHNATPGETSVNHFDISASGRIALGEATFFGYGAAFAINDINSDDPVPAPARLGELTLNAGITQLFSKEWRGSVFARPGYYGDFESYTSRTLNAPLIALANYAPSGSSVVWLFGMSVNPIAEYPVLPVVSFRWAFAAGWSLNLGFPRLGVTWQATKALDLSLSATMQGGGYRVTKTPGNSGRGDLANTHVNYREIRAGVRATYKIAGKTSLSLEGGWMADRRFDYYDRDYEIKGKPAAYMTAGVDVKF